ncbi:MAG: hypothetical protein A4E45_00594 [Methanosaeta sp. PtaB.Bin039]|nr:MAG: hypothetical protein A4E45_00594 [Methanosaeta sp. PtaB.Bin039]OPY47530.1 MAG: hypothetical protein A4E47_00250 [Methanosaeta sp. PtaU1.Bin028]HOT06877.1 DUF99 family protein [Methanotrichaceae archaeon]HQF16773.1 DUF99 family protein [Methanotrichaceae archaeon]HQI91405.1 DUF99 family protein [Methanotrichaceae archaeon]
MLHLSKSGLRVLGVAESFLRAGQSSVLAGVVMRGDMRVDGVAISRITVGGDDATSGVMQIWQELRRQDINAIMLNGSVIAWFNILDPGLLHSTLCLPVISLTYDESDGLERYLLQYFQRPEDKISRYQALGERKAVQLKTGYKAFVRCHGTSLDEARILLNRFLKDGRVPEPIRLARLVARAALRQDKYH